MQVYAHEPEGADVKCSVCGSCQEINETNEFSDELTYTKQRVAYDAVDGKYLC